MNEYVIIFNPLWSKPRWVNPRRSTVYCNYKYGPAEPRDFAVLLASRLFLGTTNPPVETRDFAILLASRLFLGTTNPPVETLPLTQSEWWSDRDLKPPTYLHLQQNSRMSGAVPSFSLTPSCSTQRQLYKSLFIRNIVFREVQIACLCVIPTDLRLFLIKRTKIQFISPWKPQSSTHMECEAGETVAGR
jgi:hypothetical protein